MKKIIKLALVLFLIAAIVAGVLGVVNELTKDRIAQIAAKKTAEAYAEVLNAETYDDAKYEGKDTKVQKVSVAKDKDGNAIGYVVETVVTGSQGSITVIVGVDNDLKCTGISITDSSETSGLGAVASSPSDKGVAFRANFVGQGKDLDLTKNGGEIDQLTGATITSTAVVTAVRSAITACESLG